MVIFPPKAFNSSERVWTGPEEWFIDWKKKEWFSDLITVIPALTAHWKGIFIEEFITDTS